MKVTVVEPYYRDGLVTAAGSRKGCGSEGFEREGGGATGGGGPEGEGGQRRS